MFKAQENEKFLVAPAGEGLFSVYAQLNHKSDRFGTGAERTLQSEILKLVQTPANNQTETKKLVIELEKQLKNYREETLNGCRSLSEEVNPRVKSLTQQRRETSSI